MNRLEEKIVSLVSKDVYSIGKLKSGNHPFITEITLTGLFVGVILVMETKGTSVLGRIFITLATVYFLQVSH